MSNEEDKIKHSKRLLKDESAINKQVKIAKNKGLNVDEPHRFDKRHAMDCGSPKCMMCSREKVFGERTIQEKKFIQTEKWED
jgi:hypothetical protein